ncbi:transcriptional regulator [Amycolatopsis sp. VS8301801F10]|uniref:transcriptional regulator n=1 Tax=unclassified Amycolatopsis TaxID=2618356 RepID=UPI0038FD0139
MIKDYGQPPRADEIRNLIERRLKEVADATGPRETQTVDWRGKQVHLDVVEVKIGDLYYNPATHRVRAQRSHDPRLDALVDEDPWSVESQQYLDKLLKSLSADPTQIDPAFTELKESLREYKQTEPGLTTVDGVLVNGNTRRAALMELHGPEATMRVAVLPASCDWSDVRDVELSLQLRKEHRRDYSYINRLLAIDELVSQGVPMPAIAQTFRSTVPACEQDLWVFSAIKSMIERSEADGRRIPLIEFERDQEKMRELARTYQKVKAVKPDDAEILKEVRLAAIALDFSKTDVRFIEPDFLDRYLSPRLPDGFIPETESAEVAIPGLGRSVKAGSSQAATARAFTDKVLRAVAEKSATADGTPDSWTEVRSLVENAIKLAGSDQTLTKKKRKVSDRVTAATDQLQQCVTDLVMSRADRSLDEEAFNDALLKLKKVLRRLAVEGTRTVNDPGEGVDWLRHVMLESGS